MKKIYNLMLMLFKKVVNWVKLIGSASSCCNSIFPIRKFFTSSLFRNPSENLQQIPFDFDEDSITDGSSSQEYSRPNNQTTQSTATSALCSPNRFLYESSYKLCLTLLIHRYPMDQRLQPYQRNRNILCSFEQYHLTLRVIRLVWPF